MVRQRTTEGAILEININNEYYTYAQILRRGLGFAFFDYKSEKRLKDITILNQCDVLFIVPVNRYVVSQGMWLKVGKLPIREDLKTVPLTFIQDPIDSSIFRLYNPNTGEMFPATREECEGLECCAVWADNHVEERIKSHYAGEKSINVEMLKIKEVE